jgi:hypothetical protein
VQYLISFLVEKGKDGYILSYSINSRVYKTIINPVRGPFPIISVHDENMNDVTAEVLPFFGAERNWGGKKYKPSFWNKKQLIITLYDGERKFSEDEEIDTK